ncbi:MAG: helix-turn-helix domain-containing protein [Sarcina sp.]
MKLTEVFTIKEIEVIYGFKIEKIKSYIKRGAKDWKLNVDYRKSGGTWLITRNAIEKKFGIDLIPEDELFI